MKQMKRLTVKEEEIMRIFWEHGPMFVRELLSFYDEPKPHYNTVSTLVRGLEEKGFVGYKAYGNTYQYYALVSKRSIRVRHSKKWFPSIIIIPISMLCLLLLKKKGCLLMNLNR